MLTSNEQTIMREIRRELEQMRERLFKVAHNPKASTAERTIGFMLWGQINLICNMLLHFEMFAGQSTASLAMLDTLKRILGGEGSAMWEALAKTTPLELGRVESRWPLIMAIDPAGGPSSTVFAEAIRQADGEIELGVMGTLRTYRAGSWIRCGYCDQTVRLNEDGRIPMHHDWKGGGETDFACAGSHMIPNLANAKPTIKSEPGRFQTLRYTGYEERPLLFFDPGFAEKRHGFCSVCGETQEVKEGLIISHNTPAGFECGGSGKKGVPASEAYQLQAKDPSQPESDQQRPESEEHEQGQQHPPTHESKS